MPDSISEKAWGLVGNKAIYYIGIIVQIETIFRSWGGSDLHFVF